MRSRGLRAAGLLMGALLLLTACTAGGTEPTASPDASSSPSASPTPSGTLRPSGEPTPEPETEPDPEASTGRIPADCALVGSSATRAATLDQMTLQGDGNGFVRPVPAGARLILGCDWIQGEASGYLLLISETDAASADAVIATLPADGWACGAGAEDGDICTRTSSGATESIVSRAGVWLYQSAVNTDGEALLADLGRSIWAS